MRRLFNNLFLLLILLTFTGCGVTFPFAQNLSYHYVDKAKALKTSEINPIELKWIPLEFPNRIDIQGPSGSAGAATRVRIPTGSALATRILQVIDEAIGIEHGSDRILTITVLEAKNQFRYGMWTPCLSYGECLFKAKFNFNGISWIEEFNESLDDSKETPTTYYRLEMVWDKIALKVGESVVSHLTK